MLSSSTLPVEPLRHPRFDLLLLQDAPLSGVLEPLSDLAVQVDAVLDVAVGGVVRHLVDELADALLGGGGHGLIIWPNVGTNRIDSPSIR